MEANVEEEEELEEEEEEDDEQETPDIGAEEAVDGSSSGEL